MTKRVRLDEEATAELEAAADWYEARRPGLGIELLIAVRETLTRIEDRPHAWPLVHGLRPHLQGRVRACLLRRFPYSVVYVELEDELRGLALSHASREPGYWQRRF